MENHIWIFLVLVISILINGCSSLKCFTCAIKEDDSDTTCLDNPKSLDGGITDCDKKYCTIQRVDYKDPKSKLSSMVRNCVDKPIYINKVIEDDKFRTYYKACRQDLCNDGNGRGDASSGTIGSLGDKSTIYCPGTSTDSATVTNISLVIVAICAVFSYILG